MKIEKFKALSDEKKLAITRAAKAEFAEHGFEQASTNIIIKKAKISKGSLFNYFGSKETLYMYLINECEEEFFERLVPVLENMSPDIISRLRDIAEFYTDLYIEEADTFKFLMTLSNPENRQLALRYQEEFKSKGNQQLQQMFSGLDLTGLRVDLNGALKVITWTMTGLKTNLFSKTKEDLGAKDFKNEFMQEFDLLLKVLKNGIYQGEK